MDDTLIGTRVGHYRVVDLLATGGMGAIFAGRDEVLERRVALKAIRPEFSLNEEAKARLLREARALSQLGHPNICQIYDYVAGPESDLLVLEFVEGKNLRQLLKRGLGEEVRWGIVQQLAGVLVAAHEKGIIHRDLKPENVMLTDDGQVKVLDFGLSGLLSDQVDTELRRLSSMKTLGGLAETGQATPEQAADSKLPTDSSGRLTTAGTILGTLGYMSPEQARSETATAASDMYSFGLLIQELFTGKPPYERGLDTTALLERTLRGETLPAEGVDPDLKALIGRLKSPAASARPSAVDTAEKLAWIRLKPARRRRRLLAWSAAAALVLFSAAMAVQSIRATRAEKKAQRETATAQKVTEFLEAMFKLYEPGEAKGSTVTAKELLDAGTKKAQEDLKGDPALQARLMGTMGGLYSSLGYSAEAEPLLQKALETQERLTGPESLETAAALKRLGQLRDGKEAEDIFNRAMNIYQKVKGPEGAEIVGLLNDLAWVARSRDDEAGAEARFRQALAMAQRALPPDDPHIAYVEMNLGQCLSNQKKFDEAAVVLQSSIRRLEKVPGADELTLASGLISLGALYSDQEKYSEAEALFKRALPIFESRLGPQSHGTGGVLLCMGKMYLQRGQDDYAVATLGRAATVFESEPADLHMACMCNWMRARASARMGDRAGTLDALRRAVDEGLAIPEILTDLKELQSLKGDPEFEKLVRVVQLRAEEKKGAQASIPPTAQTK